MADIEINSAQLAAALKELDLLAKKMRDPEWYKSALAEASGWVVVQAKKRVRKSKEVHYFYKNRRKGMPRRKTVDAADKVKIYPGNLSTSIQYLAHLKRTPNAVVGPKIINKIGNRRSIGKSKTNASGYYAHMGAYSDAENFRTLVMEPALSAATPRIVELINSRMAKRTAAVGKQLTFWK